MKKIEPFKKKELIHKILVPILLIVSSIFYGIYSGVQKDGLNKGLSPLSFALISMVYSCLFLLPFAIKDFKKRKKKLQLKDYKNFFLLGTTSTVLGLLFKLYGLKMTTAINTAVLTTSLAIFLTLFARLILKEEIPKKFLITIVLMSIGFLLFKFDFTKIDSPKIGDLLILFYVILMALTTIIAKKFLMSMSTSIVTLFRILFGLPLLLLFYILSKNFLLSDFLSFYPIIAGALYTVAIICNHKAIKIVKISNVALYTLLIPIATFIYAYLFIGENVSIIQWIGIFIILGSLWFYLKSIIPKKYLERIRIFT